MQSTDTRLANNAVIDSDRAAVITIGGKEYALLLTTRATKEISMRYGGLYVNVKRMGLALDGLIRREYPTAIGPVDIMARDAEGLAVAIEIKRRGEIDGVEQLTRYLELLNRDPLLSPVRGIFAAQEIKPQARVLAEDRGIECVVLDYHALRGVDDSEHRLF